MPITPNKSFVLEHIQKIKAYNPPLHNRRGFKKNDGILADFNERLIPFSESLQATITERIKQHDWNLYPEYTGIVEAVAAYAGLKDSKNLMLTSAGSEGIGLVFQACITSGDSVIIPTPSFTMFDHHAMIRNAKIIAPSYTNDLQFPFDEVMQLLTSSPKLLVICNPNNPTGTQVPLNQLQILIETAEQYGTLVMVDEAYVEFSAVTALSLLEQYENMVIVRTFSKAFGLAGLRAGYLMTSEVMIKEFLKIRSPYSLNMMAVYGIQACLQHQSELDAYIREVTNISKPLLMKYFIQNNITHFPTDANFILIQPEDKTTFIKYMEANGIRLRNRNEPLIKDCIRYTIGTQEQTEKFIDLYDSYLAQI